MARDAMERAIAVLETADDPGVYSTVPIAIDTLAALVAELEAARAVVEAARGNEGASWAQLLAAIDNYDAAKAGKAVE